MTPSLFWRLRLLLRLQNKQLLPRPSIEKNINLIKTLLKKATGTVFLIAEGYYLLVRIKKNYFFQITSRTPLMKQECLKLLKNMRIPQWQTWNSDDSSLARNPNDSCTGGNLLTASLLGTLTTTHLLETIMTAAWKYEWQLHLGETKWQLHCRKTGWKAESSPGGKLSKNPDDSCTGGILMTAHLHETLMTAAWKNRWQLHCWKPWWKLHCRKP